MAAVIVFVLLVLLVVVLRRVQRNRLGRPTVDLQVAHTPFKKNKYFLSNAEQAFYRVLRSVIGQRFEVFAKVRLLDVLWLPPQVQGKQKFKNMVQSKHLDFVLCEPKTMLPTLVIELDDSSHQRAENSGRDALKDRVLSDAGLPLLRVKVCSVYDVRALASALEGALPGAVGLCAGVGG